MTWNEEAGMTDEVQRSAQTVTVAELDTLIEQLIEKEKEVLAADRIKKDRMLELLALESRMVHYLKDLKREDYDSPHGKFKIETKWRVNVPKDDVSKRELFDHLRSRSIFDK